MTPEERQAFQNLLNAVRVLEACQNNTENGIELSEPVSETDPKLLDKLDQTCDHTLGSDYFRDEQFPYCPKCGEKL